MGLLFAKARRQASEVCSVLGVGCSADPMEQACAIKKMRGEVVGEFKIKQGSKYNEYSPNTFGFDYRFVLPKATKDVRSKMPFKFIHEEYLITPAKSLLGNIGGNLGMFVGFSLIGLFEWILSAMASIKSRIETMPIKNAR